MFNATYIDSVTFDKILTNVIYLNKIFCYHLFFNKFIVSAYNIFSMNLL